jgi:hypothetical protein
VPPLGRLAVDDSSGLEFVVMEMLGKSRDERFASMDAVDAALAAVERRLAAPIESRVPSEPPGAAKALAEPLHVASPRAREQPSAARARSNERIWPVAAAILLAALGGSIAGAWLARGGLQSAVAVETAPTAAPIFVPAPTLPAPVTRPHVPETAIAPPAPASPAVPGPQEVPRPLPKARARRDRRPAMPDPSGAPEAPREAAAPGLLPFPAPKP